MSRGERGLSASVEAAIILPVLVLFLGLLISLVRVSIAQQHVDSAAASGARAASLERGSRAAESAARDAVEAALVASDTGCSTLQVGVEAAALEAPLASAGSVRVEITCEASLSDVALPLIPGGVTLNSARSSPVDPLRGR